MSDERSLHSVFLRSAERVPERPALEVDGATLSYDELRTRALQIAATLIRRREGLGGDPIPPLTAVVMQRSATGFAGILGALCSGHGYVPMMPSLPAARISLMLARAGTRTVVIDRAAETVMSTVLEHAEQAMLIVAPDMDRERLAALVAESPAWAGHTVVTQEALAQASAWDRPTVTDDDIAYLLFTSGSTGEPKGVMVAHRNIDRFLNVVSERYGLRETDRFSHLFEITFDLSLFDMFAAWKCGGCLCVPSMGQRLLPSRYVTDAKLTIWFSVPSAAVLMKDMRQLVPDAFPELRVALFCGEALPVPVAEAFAAASPNAVVENIYGPTELTLACTHYRWHEGTAAESENDVVPIGEPYPEMKMKIVDADLADVAPGETGELLMTGPQLTLGYWRDETRTAAAFMVPPGETETYYRTGDRVRAPTPGPQGRPMTFLGRMDSQIKINGYRVELGEIEAVLRQEAGVDAAVALGWPKTPGGASGVVAFVAVGEPGDPRRRDLDVNAILDRLETRLPKYMVPKSLRVLDVFPLNTNGKIDRKVLLSQLQGE